MKIFHLTYNCTGNGCAEEHGGLHADPLACTEVFQESRAQIRAALLTENPGATGEEIDAKLDAGMKPHITVYETGEPYGELTLKPDGTLARHEGSRQVMADIIHEELRALMALPLEG